LYDEWWIGELLEAWILQPIHTDRYQNIFFISIADGIASVAIKLYNILIYATNIAILFIFFTDYYLDQIRIIRKPPSSTIPPILVLSM
jgi:hypothetical protein